MNRREIKDRLQVLSHVEKMTPLQRSEYDRLTAELAKIDAGGTKAKREYYRKDNSLFASVQAKQGKIKALGYIVMIAEPECWVFEKPRRRLSDMEIKQLLERIK